MEEHFDFAPTSHVRAPAGTLIRYPRGLSAAARDRVKMVMDSKQLQSFLEPGRPSRLFIAGPDEVVQEDDALTFVCAKLVQELANQPRPTTWVISYCWFQNPDPRDKCDRSTMMASLTNQLAEYLAFHIEESSNNPLLEFEKSSIPHYDPHQPRSLEGLFKGLVKTPASHGHNFVLHPGWPLVLPNLHGS